ncbi:MAG: type II toxin-antitoxin system RelB/DinJ family antitoxin [Bacteroidetes bacterium]|nr:type II toxin-antitoxin system RelB/DinJ family antitoxin [Bacteroidota bacterium]
MNKTSTVHARIEPGLKDKAELVFQELGLTATQAITLFYKQVELRKGLPFDIVIPTKTTQRTFDDTDAGRNLIVCKDVDDMFGKLGL